MFLLGQFASMAGGHLRRRGLGDRGAALVEYALLIVLVAAFCIVAIEFFGAENSKSIDSSADSIASS